MKRKRAISGRSEIWAIPESWKVNWFGLSEDIAHQKKVEL